jgi:hypothetical protein
MGKKGQGDGDVQPGVASLVLGNVGSMLIEGLLKAFSNFVLRQCIMRYT